MSYSIKQIKKINPKSCILIEGLPGIGNVGKIAVDFMIDAFKAEKVYEIYSNSFPHAVFVNEKNLVELPSIEIYHAENNKNNFLLLSGDIQPVDEVSCHKFCNEILLLAKKYKCKEIITLGGIGLSQIPKKPKVYSTANTKKIIKKYSSKNLSNNIHGVVGPIIGVSGLLVGLAKRQNIPAMALLAETYAHQNYIGIKGAKEILKVLKENLKLKIDISQLDDEIVNIETEILEKTKKISQIQRSKKSTKDNITDYIG